MKFEHLNPLTGVVASHAPAIRAPDRRRLRAHDTDDAVCIANDRDYGLSAAVFTRDIEHGLTVARRIRLGICHVNGPTVHDAPQMPFGGMGASG